VTMTTVSGDSNEREVFTLEKNTVLSIFIDTFLQSVQNIIYVWEVGRDIGR
jgi:hypothetical protein